MISVMIKTFRQLVTDKLVEHTLQTMEKMNGALHGGDSYTLEMYEADHYFITSLKWVLGVDDDGMNSEGQVKKTGDRTRV